MDPLSIASSVVGLTATCLSTCKKLHDLAGEYQDVPAVIAMICSESTIISIGLSELQMKILRRDDLAQAWASNTEIWTAFETALTGCMVVFSCLEAETRGLRSKNPGVWAKIKFIWNQDRLKELLGALRGQQSSITFLLNLLELETLSSIQKDIRKNAPRIKAAASEAQSLRSWNPSVKMDCESIFDNNAGNLSFFHVDAISGNAPSELDFEFDNLVINSQAYRRVFIKAQSESQPPQAEDVAPVKAVDKGRVQSQKTATSLVTLSREKAISYAKDLVRPSSRKQESSNWTDLQIIRPVLLASTTTCYGCLRSIAKDHMRALGGTWHVGCLKCYDCGVPLESGYHLLQEGNGIPPKPLCRGDYSRRQDVQCFKCLQPIIGDFVTALGRRYHATHFTCDRCEIVFAKESDYQQQNGGIYCMLHFCREVAFYCHGCKFPLIGNYCEKQGDGSKWHTCCLELLSWGLELPVSTNGRRYLDSIQDQSLNGLSKFYSQLHDTRANAIYVCGSSYLEQFRDSVTKYFSLTRGGSRAETYEAFKIILSMLSCLFIAASKANTDRAGEHAIMRFSFHSWKYFVRNEQRLKAPSPEAVGQGVSDLLLPLLSLSFEVYLQSNDTSWDAKDPQLDEFVNNLKASRSFQLDDCYSHFAPEALADRWKCAKCPDLIAGHGFCEPSSPYRKLHARCYSKITCDHEALEGCAADGFLMRIVRYIKYGEDGIIGMCDQIRETEMWEGDIVC
ncbi:GTPase-activating of the rho rac family (LRG1) [Fusarium pseudoanthophilum]|uniref:GTPase-activating of the rho rac family (LRG1) n=1 Tax=Fusarium pseudoanthophilum TaxID=48495 RepID=A0A8H5USV7_9HYPO|nr:GTPase-activating of the rho rac family (LRG1) [Fusarium pseudoanthophilum]